MPKHLVDRVEFELVSLDNKKIVVLGLAYRGGVKEAAFSGTWDLINIIASKGGIAVVHDPLYSDDELCSLGLVPHQLGEHADAAILHTNHAEYKLLKVEDLPGVQLIADGRNFLSNELKAEIKTYVLGQG
jgi:UDP-N-acetyl-D-mannosaminuronate dehydrogenase